jgi:hypothetical protein
MYYRIKAFAEECKKPRPLKSNFMPVNQNVSMKDIEYTFGTNSTAASRLEEIGKYFNPHAADFIRQCASGVPDIAVAHKWVTQLNPGGILFIEEIDAIDTTLDVFKTYLAMSEGIIATQGASLFLGKILGASEYEADLMANDSVVLTVANWQAASWFFPNTQTIWNENTYVLDRLTLKERKSIADELVQLKGQKDSRSDITWMLRRLALRKGMA